LNNLKKKRDQLKKEKQKHVLEKYGGEEHLETPDRQLLLGESEAYVEYAQTGEVIKGQEKSIPKTKYIEDILENNHSEIWGSFWKDGKWGYSCCQQTLRNTYCTGEEGKALENNEPEVRKLLPPVPQFSALPALKHQVTAEVNINQSVTNGATKKRKAASNDTQDTMAKKHKRALNKEKKRLHKEKKLNGTTKVDPNEIPTGSEMEQYHKQRKLHGDPMANYVDTAA